MTATDEQRNRDLKVTLCRSGGSRKGVHSSGNTSLQAWHLHRMPDKAGACPLCFFRGAAVFTRAVEPLAPVLQACSTEPLALG